MRPSPLLIALLALALLAGCSGPGEEAGTRPSPAQAPGADRAQAPALHPFFLEAQGYLAAGDLESAEVVFENNRILDDPDRLTLLAGAGVAFLSGRANRAAIDLADAHRIAGPDCMTLVFLGTARRRVDVATGSKAAWQGVLQRADCPPPAYAVAAERFARNDDPVAEGRLPGEPFPEDVPRSALLVLLPPRSEGPGFEGLARAARSTMGGTLHVLGDRFQEEASGATVTGHWISHDLALLAAFGGPAAPSGGNDGLQGLLEEIREEWLRERGGRTPADAWAVESYAHYRDVRGRFELDVPEGWYANLFAGPGPTLYVFAPLEIDDPKAEPLRSGEVPSFTLTVREREEPPAGFTPAEIDIAVAEASAPFYGVDHATEPQVETGTVRIPYLRFKRSFVLGGEVYRLGAAVLRPEGWTFEAAFAAPADRFDRVEPAFWRAVDSLRPPPDAPASP